MLEFVKENFTGNPKLYPQMVMFILKTMVSQMDLEGISVACEKVSTLTVTVQKIASSVDAFDYRLRALETIAGL